MRRQQKDTLNYRLRDLVKCIAFRLYHIEMSAAVWIIVMDLLSDSSQLHTIVSFVRLLVLPVNNCILVRIQIFM